MKKAVIYGSVSIILSFLIIFCLPMIVNSRSSGSPYKVYVILGFHANFYHSWRGDTPDEAGFGTDIRIVREIIKMLDEANARGLDARGYWEGENLFTWEDIVRNHAPDIIEGIRRRVDAGLDEFMLAPYSNSLFSAMTEDEVRAAIRWSISNPWGSGIKDLFGSYYPMMRTQEGTFTTGLIPILKEEGVEGVTFYYSVYPFTSISNFVPVWPDEQRYTSTTMKMQDNGESILLFPAVSVPDVVSFTSLEVWMLKLRKLQTSGEVEKDLVIHINFDADAETWIPLLPEGMRWFPNGGGLPEYIKYVNKYEWAEFALPSKYLSEHPPVGEVLVRQDLADGPWDGNYAWAEKYPSHMIWTELEKSRLHTLRAEALMEGSPEKIKEQANTLLYEGRESSFFKRLAGVSTTHFGMSTPMVNEERQAVAESIVAAANAQALSAERLVVNDLMTRDKTKTGNETRYTFMIKDIRDGSGEAALQLVRIPVVLPESMPAYFLEDNEGGKVDGSIVNLEPLGNGRQAAELLIALSLHPGEVKKIHLKQTRGVTTVPPGLAVKKELTTRMANDSIELRFDNESGISSFRFNGREVGGADFLDPFISYKTGKKPESYHATGYEIADLSAERRQGVKRARLKTLIPFTTDHGEAEVKLEITLNLPDDASWMVADVVVDYPYTIKKDVLNSMQQKLRRYLDLNWIEVAPFQIHPLLDGSLDRPLKVWKHNWLDVTSWYELNYGQINTKNAELDSFNHQVTAGWVAVTDRSHGLLVAQSAEVLTSYAFMVMRLRDKDGRQQLYLNPFGSYHGRQMDYSHLGGNGLGAEMAEAIGAQFRPNASSYNGMSERFSLLFAPYSGDEPPSKLQAEAMAFFYPASVIYMKTPPGIDAVIKEDMEKIIAGDKRQLARKARGPLPVPLAFLANPTEAAVDLVWDEPGDERIDGYDIEWRAAEETKWNTIQISPDRRHRIEPVENGLMYAFRVRAAGMGKTSEWTETLEVVVGPVKNKGALSMAKGVDPAVIFKTLYYGLVHVLTTP